MGLGIIPVVSCFSKARVLRHLPPEHRILSVRSGEDTSYSEYLIEGPLMPDDIHTLYVKPRTSLFLMMVAAQNGRYELTAQFLYPNKKESATWIVGEWQNMDAYRAEMDAL